VRSALLKEVDGLSQSQSDWRPREGDWSIGEIIHHLTLAEVNTGKLTSKLLKSVPDGAAFPADLHGFAPLPPPMSGAQAPEAVRPAHGQPIGRLLAEFEAARARTRQSIERLAGCDPRALSWPHPAFGQLDLAQWWTLQARHDQDHLEQVRAVKAAAGYPRAGGSG
jgi:hypothetical protein